MADVSLKTMEFEGLDDKYTIPQTLSDLGGQLNVNKLDGILPTSKGGTGTNDIGSLKDTLGVPNIDDTLSVEGDAADAKAVGDKFRELYLTPQMFGAVGDGETDDSEAFQSAIDEGGRLFVPAGTYIVDGVSGGTDIEIILDPAAKIKHSATADYMFTFEDCSVKVKGGEFSKQDGEIFTKNLVRTSRYDDSGIFKLTGCFDCVFETRINGNNSGVGLYCIGVDGIEIDMTVKNTVGAGVLFVEGNRDILVKNYEHIGAYIPDTINGVSNNYDEAAGTGQWWSYTLATGFKQYSTPCDFIHNMTVENFYAENCDWEGIDSHGGENIHWKNIRIKNARRFLTCYMEEKAKLLDGLKMQNIVIENVVCENEVDYIDVQKPWLKYMGGVGTNENSWKMYATPSILLRGTGNMPLYNVTLKNINLIRPNHLDTRGVFSMSYIRNLDMENIIIDGKGVAYNLNRAPIRPFYCYDMRMKNVTVKGTELHSDASAGHYLGIYACSGFVDGFHVINENSFKPYFIAQIVDSVASYVKFRNVTGGCKYAKISNIQKNCGCVGEPLLDTTGQNYVYFTGKYYTNQEIRANMAKSVTGVADNSDIITLDSSASEFAILGIEISITQNETTLYRIVTDVLGDKLYLSESVNVTGAVTVAYRQATIAIPSDYIN